MFFKRMTATVAATLLAASLSGTALAQNFEITGAGATFPAPIYTAWASAFRAATGNTVNYQAVGSGAGITQAQNRTVDFGASDAPLPAQRLQQQRLFQFPAVIGAVVPIINLEGVAKNQLRLTGPMLADIYRGVIRMWNDPQIVAINPGVNLPNTAIQPIYRSDGSGTTFVFTSYLSEVSPEWKANVGAQTSVQWPTGAGARGNDGVAGAVRNTRGSIGYVEYAFAAENNLSTTQLSTRTGAFVESNIANFQAAATAADWETATDLAASMLNMPGPNSWPIVSPTYILLPRDARDPVRSRNVLQFFTWAYTEPGDRLATGLHYIPLPQPVVERVKAAWRTLRDAQNQPLFAN